MKRIQIGDEVYLTYTFDPYHVLKGIYLGEVNNKGEYEYIHVVKYVEEIDLKGNVVKIFHRNEHCKILYNFMFRSLQDAIDSLDIYDILE